MLDKVTQERVRQLHPCLKEEIEEILKKVNTKILTGRAKVRIAQGFRTFEEQDALFNKRPKVTNARGGQSFHNYGLAFDIVLMLDGKEASWNTNADFDGDGVSDWMEVVKEFTNAGYEWGGHWKTIVDMPHFQKTKGYTLKEIQEKHNKKDFIPGTKFVNI